MAKHGILPELDDMFGPGGQALLDEMASKGSTRCGWSRCGICWSSTTGSSTMVERQMRKMFKDHAGYQAIQAITGVGPGHGRHLRAPRSATSPLPHRPASVLVGRA